MISIGQQSFKLFQFSELLQDYCKKSPSTQLDCLYALEDFASENDAFSPVAVHTIKHLYDLDVVLDESILLWHRKKSEEQDEEKEKFASKIRLRAKPLIEWLEASEEEDSSEEESD